MMDLGHRFRHCLMQFDEVGSFKIQGFLDVGVESNELMALAQGPPHPLHCDLPRVYVDCAYLQLLQDRS